MSRARELAEWLKSCRREGGISVETATDEAALDGIAAFLDALARREEAAARGPCKTCRGRGRLLASNDPDENETRPCADCGGDPFDEVTFQRLRADRAEASLAEIQASNDRLRGTIEYRTAHLEQRVDALTTAAAVVQVDQERQASDLPPLIAWQRLAPGAREQVFASLGALGKMGPGEPWRVALDLLSAAAPAVCRLALSGDPLRAVRAWQDRKEKFQPPYAERVLADAFQETALDALRAIGSATVLDAGDFVPLLRWVRDHEELAELWRDTPAELRALVGDR